MVTITAPAWLAWVILVWAVVSVALSGILLYYQRKIDKLSLDRERLMYDIQFNSLKVLRTLREQHLSQKQ